MIVRIYLFLFLISGLAVHPASSAETTSTTGRNRPNIIFIMADDLGQEALACYGNDVNRTPNLDRMATEGMKFTEAHATPLCTPTRVQVMTGKYNHRNYVSFGLLEKTQKTFATYLKEAGYVTGVAGKWQLYGNEEQQQNAGDRTGALPQEVGFDQYCLWQVQERGPRYKDPVITTNTSGTQEYKGRFGPDVFNEFAIDFIRDNKARPFFLYYPMVLTHAPFQPTPGNPDYAQVTENRPTHPKYFRGQVEYMDKMVGQLLDELADLGLTENTLVIFTGDNGTGRNVKSTVKGQQIQGAKGETTRFGTNVPMIVSWKGVIEPGKVNENLVDFTDMLPTFLEAASAKLPGGGELDGRSLMPQLRSLEGPVRNWVFCYYHPQLHKDKKFIWAHDKNWKLYSDGRFYNLQTDVMEQTPLSAEALAEEGKAARERLQKVIDDQLTRKAAP